MQRYFMRRQSVIQTYKTISFDNLEMLETISKFSWDRFAVWLLYICAQILVLATLLFTTATMAVHVVIMLFTILLYFITALRNPGFYQGVVQPNQEDAQLSTSKSPPHLRPPFQHGNTRDELAVPTFRSQRANEKCQKIEKQPQLCENVQTAINASSSRSKKVSIEEHVVNFIEKEPSEITQEKEALPVEGKKSARFNFLLVAKSMFSVFKTKKENQPSEDLSDKHSKSSKNQSPSKRSQKQPEKQALEDRNISIKEQAPNEQEGKSPEKVEEPKIVVSFKESAEEEYVSSTLKEKGCNSAIGKEDFSPQQIEAQFEGDGKIEALTCNSKSIVKKMEGIKRYCRMCESYQPLRIKHCYSCQRCVATFDHHCPWMGTCIGEKNKLFFLIYLLLQTIQLLAIVIDLIFCIAANRQNSSSVGILLMATLLFFILLASLLTFHLYLLGINLTTWELLRWNKIEYLSLFDRTKISSPFSKGVVYNLKQLLKITMSDDLKKWIEEISEDLSKSILRKGRQVKSEIHMLDSDRRPFRSQKVV